MKKVKKGVYNFNDPLWEKVSKEAIDFIKLLLTVDPAERPTAEEALKSPWLS
jgi:calcium/calmodulin-dependent protein kinase I